jgi:hypothetical protein
MPCVQWGGSILDEKLILNASTPGMYSFLCKRTKTVDFFVCSSDLLRKGHTFPGLALNKYPKTLTSYSEIKDFLIYTG